MLIMHALYACKAMSQHASQKGDVAPEAIYCTFKSSTSLPQNLDLLALLLVSVIMYQEVPPYLTVGTSKSVSKLAYGGVVKVSSTRKIEYRISSALPPLST